VRNDHANHAKGWLAGFRRDQQAVSASEYAILLSLLVLGAMATIMSIGLKFEVIYLAIANALPTGL